MMKVGTVARSFPFNKQMIKLSTRAQSFPLNIQMIEVTNDEGEYTGSVVDKDVHTCSIFSIQ